MLAPPTRRRAGWAAAIAILTIASSIALTSGAPAQAQSPAYELQVTPTDAIVDGQAIDITMRAAPGKRLAFSGLVYICRPDGVYATTDDLNPAAGNCPASPLSSSGSPLPTSIVAYPDGSTSVTRLRVGTGTAQWGPAEDPARFSLTCDLSNPCRLVVSTLLGSQRVIDSSYLLTFADANPIGACGGTEPAAPAAAGPDRLTGAWIDLTRAKCQATGSKVATQSVFAGEGDGHRAFANGLADFTYSAVGPTFASPETATRSSVSVPIGLNAVVIGVLGGYATTDANWPAGVAKPFDDVKVTMGEMATLFGKDPFAFDALYTQTLRDRNPQMQRAPVVSTLKPVPLAPAGADATSWFASSAFDTLAPSEWVSSPIGVDGNSPNAPRGVHESFALADPPFSISFVELYSSLGQVKRTAAQAESAPGQYGPIWILTDLATAREIGIPTVALQNSSGAFVEPTEESLLAAAPDLQLQADGTYLPQVAASSSASAYPLTFVEHAVVPTEPLVDASCAARTATQQILAEWLAYVTGPGQSELPSGIVALPPTLAAQAAQAQSLVGTAALTGACAPAPPPPDPTAAPAPPGDAAVPGAPPAPSFPSSGLPISSFDGVGGPGVGVPSGGVGGAGSFASGGSGFADVALAGEDGILGTEDDLALDEIAYPDPTGGGGGNGTATALALVVLAVLVAVGGWLSSGRRVDLPGRRS